MTLQKTDAHRHRLLSLFFTLKRHHHCGFAVLLLVATLLFLSALTAVNLNTENKLYLMGDIAQSDVVADKDLYVEDPKGTEERISNAILLQPPIYDLTLSPYLKFQDNLVKTISSLNTKRDAAQTSEEEPVPPRTANEEAFTASFSEEILEELARPEVQDVLLKQILPLILQKMSIGLVSDLRQSHVSRAGILVHDLDTDRMILRPELTSLPDVHSMLAEISVKLRQNTRLTHQSRRALNVLLQTTLPPASLTLNQEATKRKEDEIRNSIRPVLYHLQKGESIVQKGERVSREQFIKLQAFYQSSKAPLDVSKTLGVFFTSLFIALGFFIAPSGKPGTPLYRKDVVLISLLLLCLGLSAFGAYALVLKTDPKFLPILITLLPVASVVGLTATIFAARRYCTMGLLTAFFTTLLLHAPWQVFTYYFLGSMFFTWLVVSAYNRRDTVWTIVPFTIGLVALWLCVSMLAQFPVETLPSHLVAAFASSVLSLFLLFAVSPILEILFNYSTRFRLMELMSLEQPLMQELMVQAPGTYHHSLIVANMVEAGAKAIGANSLLCKVAALYHDIGKISYPEYFIENQFGGPNRHDKLAPSMSALILLSHVKKGVELAREYGLGQEISDIIQQHHGTRIMQFFYQKALKMGEKTSESEFSYLGPRPQTKESAIIMLADSVEASSRTLTDPTPARVKSHIDKIVKGIFAEGQLDESELTFKDLHYLSENFQRILTGLFHQRIAYPEQNKQESGKGGEGAKGTDAQKGSESPKGTETIKGSEPAKGSETAGDVRKEGEAATK
ncbi:MAG: HDIG domain-containing protein [Desulfovibrio sp.]|nr:HDIG domain-containing protein [Desulfovibrio sp.]